MLALAGHVAMIQTAQRAHRAVQPAGIVHIRPAPTGRRLVRQSRQMRQPRHRLRHRAERRVVVMPSGMAVARHRYIDDVRFDAAQHVIAKAPVPQHPRAEILDHDVGHGDQLFRDFQPFRAADVERQAFLVDVGVVEVPRGVEVDLDIPRRRGAGQPAALVLRPLDLDDLGAESAEPACRPRPGPHPGKIDHANIFKGPRSSHRVLPARAAPNGRTSDGIVSAGLPNPASIPFDRPPDDARQTRLARDGARAASSEPSRPCGRKMMNNTKSVP